MSERKGHRRGPKPKAESYSRIELYWPDDAMLAELRAEAQQRGVSLQAHIRDLLVARQLARQGDSLARLLWIPAAATSTSDSAAGPAEETDSQDRAAQAFKSALLDLDDEA